MSNVIVDPMLSLLQEIRSGVEDLRARRDELEERAKLDAAIAGFREDLLRLESKLDAHSRSTVQRIFDLEKRVAILEGEGRDLKGIARMLAEAHKQLGLYRREETKPYGTTGTGE